MIKIITDEEIKEKIVSNSIIAVENFLKRVNNQLKELGCSDDLYTIIEKAIPGEITDDIQKHNRCPRCNEVLYGKDNNYCHNCGKKIIIGKLK